MTKVLIKIINRHFVRVLCAAGDSLRYYLRGWDSLRYYLRGRDSLRYYLRGRDSLRYYALLFRDYWKPTIKNLRPFFIDRSPAESKRPKT